MHSNHNLELIHSPVSRPPLSRFVAVYSSIIPLQQNVDKHLTDRETVMTDLVWGEDTGHLFLYVQRGFEWKAKI